MILGVFRKYINYLATKENRGNTITPEEFNNLLHVSMMEYVTNEYKFYETDQKSTDVLGCIRKQLGGQFNPIKVEKGLAALPSDYYRASSCGYYVTKEINGEQVSQYIVIDILSDAEYNARKNSYIIESGTYPFCRIVNNERVMSEFPHGFIEFEPKTLVAVEFAYLSEVPAAYYDYCIGIATMEEIYMPVGSVINNMNNLMLGTTVLYTNVYHVSNPVLPYTSRSVEMVFEDDQQLQIARHLTRHMGINLKDAELFQASEYLKQEENAGR